MASASVDFRLRKTCIRENCEEIERGLFPLWNILVPLDSLNEKICSTLFHSPWGQSYKHPEAWLMAYA